jgi:hypothetical protein
MEKNNDSTITQYLKIDPSVINDLGILLHQKIGKIDEEITKNNCIDYLRKRAVEGICIPTKSVVNHGLAKIFPNIPFEESPPELDHACDIDYIGYVDDSEDRRKGFGIQIKPMTAKSNFGNYSPSERMKRGFEAFTEDFLGKVFIVFSNDGEIGNKEIIEEITQEIKRLESL